MTKIFHCHFHMNPRAVPNFLMPNNTPLYILHTSYTQRSKHLSLPLMVTIIRVILLTREIGRRIVRTIMH